MRMMPIVYVSDVERALTFYRLLGLEDTSNPPSRMWAELRLGDASLGIHYIETLADEQPERVTLNFVSQIPLEMLRENLRERGITPARDIIDEAFGRSLVLRDPDGLLIQIDEHDPELYA
ncbi:MAG: VOC family protein [Anaerolineae bacterium]|nr:VOC family protein [Anaerolineae bacterium]